MKISKLRSLMSNGSYYDDTRVSQVLPRYAAMIGLEIETPLCANETEITPDQVREILALDFAERRSGDLRAMGEAMGKVSVNVPSNINVWQHLKGESTIANAARSLSDAAKVLTETIAK